MEKSTYVGPVLLLDNYSEESKLLFESFKKAGFDGPVVVINDDGFLPEGVLSVYGYFCSSEDSVEIGSPCYFDKISVPDFWEISSNNISGKVCDFDKIRAQIYYTNPTDKRLVKAVDWLGTNGKVRFTDHYNKFGHLYARTIFNKSGQRFCKTYFSSERKEILTENYGTKSISVYKDGKDYFYENKTQLVLGFFREKGIEPTRIFYNSLDVPFFVCGSIKPEGSGHVLFWQEQVGDAVPGNMLGAINEEKWGTKTIFVQRKDAYDRLIELGADANVVKPLGFVYDFVRENKYGNEALICTNSDRIEKIAELIKALPDLHFNIAAITEMSAKLSALSKYENVSLYPEAKEKTFNDLFEKCDYYFDINHYDEIVSAVKTAFIHNSLVVAFKNTVHNANYIAKDHIFEDESALVEFIKTTLENATNNKDRQKENPAAKEDQTAKNDQIENSTSKEDQTTKNGQIDNSAAKVDQTTKNDQIENSTSKEDQTAKNGQIDNSAAKVDQTAKNAMDKALALQKSHALCAKVSDYKEII